MTLKNVIEALIFGSPKPIQVPEILAVLTAAGSPEASEEIRALVATKTAQVEEALNELKEEYIASERGLPARRAGQRLDARHEPRGVAVGQAALSRSEADAPLRPRAGNAGDHRLPAARHARRCGGRARRRGRWRDAGAARPLARENHRPRRRSRPAAALRDDRVFPPALRVAEHGGAAELRRAQARRAADRARPGGGERGGGEAERPESESRRRGRARGKRTRARSAGDRASHRVQRGPRIR